MTSGKLDIEALITSGYLREFGGSGSVVIMVGDILGGSQAWTPHAEHLKDNWCVIGVSPVLVIEAAAGQIASKSWGIPTESNALLLALETKGIEKIHLVGWSLGGVIALDFALNNADRIKSLTLIEPPAWWLLQSTNRDSTDLHPPAKWFESFANKDTTEESLVSFLKEVGAIEPGIDPKSTRAWRLAWQHRLAIASSWRVIGHKDDPKRLEVLKMPVLLVKGTDSLKRDRLIIETLAELIPHSHLLEIQGRHTSHLESIKPFLSALESMMLTEEISLR